MVRNGSRTASAAGVVFVILFVVGALFALDGPNIKSTDAPQVADDKWLHYLGSSGNRIEHVLGAYLLIVAAGIFIWFCLDLRRRMVVAAHTAAGNLVAALAVLGAGAMVGGGMAAAVVPGAVSLGNEPLPSNGGVARGFADLTFPLLFVAFGLISAGLIGVVTVVTMRAPVLPRWLAYAGWIGVLGGIFGVIFLPMVLALLWFLVVALIGTLAAPHAPQASQPAAKAVSAAPA